MMVWFLARLSLLRNCDDLNMFRDISEVCLV